MTSETHVLTAVFALGYNEAELNDPLFAFERKAAIRLQEDSTTRPKRRISCWVWCLVVVGALPLLCCGICVFAVLQPSIRDLAPPIYPGSLLIKEEHRSGSGGYWPDYTYTTTATIDEVLEWYNRYLPGFKRYQESVGAQNSPAEPSSVYENKINESGIRAWIINGLFGDLDPRDVPYLYISVWSLPENPSITVIKYSYGFPGP